ncbi:MAG: hypothetical protein HY017_32905 [Betaproteobacteria bacterium]|nr:hypothetical protein [Betaproteobacteria bacterium]
MNAIEDGLPGIDSRLTQGADGYDAYLDERARGLKELSYCDGGKTVEVCCERI